MREVHILGEDVKVTFNMAVEIAYEEIIDAPFEVGSLSRQRNAMALLIAAVVVNNPDSSLTLERLMKEAKGKEIAALSQAVTAEMSEWMDIPAVELAVEKKAKKGKTSKN